MVVKYILVFILFMLLYIAVKNANTAKKRYLIIAAIFKHNMHWIEMGIGRPFVIDYPDMESYYKTLFRLWDWGYTRILPPDKFDIIEPFIESFDI